MQHKHTDTAVFFFLRNESGADNSADTLTSHWDLFIVMQQVFNLPWRNDATWRLRGVVNIYSSAAGHVLYLFIIYSSVYSQTDRSISLSVNILIAPFPFPLPKTLIDNQHLSITRGCFQTRLHTVQMLLCVKSERLKMFFLIWVKLDNEMIKRLSELKVALSFCHWWVSLAAQLKCAW